MPIESVPRALLRSSRLADAVLRTLPRDCVVVLAFHRVGDELPPWHTGTSPAALERILAAFARVARPVAIGELVGGEARGRTLAVTFDDGFADNAEIAAPLLLRLGIPAAFFLPAGCVEAGTAPWPDEAYARLLRLPPARLARLASRLAPDRAAGAPLDSAHAVVHGLKLLDPARRDQVLGALPPSDGEEGRPMTWEQGRALLAQGFDVGSHGQTHAVLTTLDDTRLRFELEESKRLLESRLGASCDAIAYPDDRVDARVAAAAGTAGYRLGFAGGARPNVAPFTPLAVQRLSGEDSRLGAVALRLRRRQRTDASFADAVSHYEGGRAEEYGFVTQARWVRSALARSRPRSVLDAGCAAGSLTPTLREAGATEIVGVDLEPAMLAAASRRWPQERWLRGDLARLPFADGELDAAVSLGVLEYVDDPVAVLRELARVVRPGGTVLISVQQRHAPNDLGFRFAESLGFGLRERSRLLTESQLRLAAARASLRPVEVRATNFFAFPFDALAPGSSRRLAEALDAHGGRSLLRPLGAQLLLEAVVEPSPTVRWLAPRLPTGTTFLDRELAELRRLGVPVEAGAPRIGPAAFGTFVRRPFASLLAVLRLQLLKAPRDRERGRLGYLALALKGMTLAAELERSRSRVHASFADGIGTVVYCAAALARVPFTFTAHSPYSLWQGSALLRAQAEAAEHVFCVSDDIERRIGALAPGSRRSVVRCLGPAEAPPREPLDTPFTLLAVGTPLPLKGFGTAIEALALALAAGADVRLEVVGEGGESQVLRERVAALGLRDRVSFPGGLPNLLVLERLASALALLAPSEVQPDGDRDGLPVSILDAAACEVPTIATAVSGIPEFVVDGESGLIVPERDPEALAAAILRLCREPQLAARLGRGARERLERLHDPEREITKLVEVWFPSRPERPLRPAAQPAD
ncbi:MAG TPA: glycosyltransferase [Gaiellaceae bacterium]|jgi:glycosyltransferase involved in cell wall biosynthesis/peptidoglycan/xylan/chitin deacetylase (PgdA/CDA1 family)|nr:glycosyltransferase [Gaiellaceae bacterium]